MKMMVGKLAKGERVFDRILNGGAVIAAAMVLFAMLLICTDVFMRLTLDKSIFWSIDIAAILLLYITFLASAWLLRADGHVKMELVVNYLNQKQQAIFKVATSAVSTLVFLALTWYGIQSMIYLAKIGHYMPTDLEPPTFLIILVIPLGSFLLFIQSIRKTCGYLRTMSSIPSGSE